MDNDLVLVIGSKPDAFFPNITPKTIYVANGAAERAIMFKEKSPFTKIISVTGEVALGVEQVRSKIEKLKPNEILSYNGNIQLEKFFDKKWINKVHFRFLEKKGLDLQKKFYSGFTLRVADLGLVFGSGNVIFGVLRLIYAVLIKKKPPMGLTTGCLSILIALIENLNSKILVTGIGLEGGNHFYEYKDQKVENRWNFLKIFRSKAYNHQFPAYRGWTDLFLIKRLPEKFKSRILTTDFNFSQKANIKLFKNFSNEKF